MLLKMTALIGTEIFVETPPKKEPKYFGFSWLTSLACGLPQKVLWRIW